MDRTRLDQSHSAYPPAVNRYLGNNVPTSIARLGNLEILKQDKLALFCSARCPAALIVQTHDLARQLTDAGVAVISGFHSPVERECLTILLRGSQPIIFCPPRSLAKMRVPKECRKPLDDGRLLFLSPFPGNRHRGDTEMALYRNRFAAALADAIFVPYAAPSSKTEQFCREMLGWQKPVYTFAGTPAENLITLGVKPLQPGEEVQTILRLRESRRSAPR